MASIVYFSLGSNLGEKERNIQNALALIAKRIGRILACSANYENKAWGFASEHLFLNAAAKVETELPIQKVLTEILHIERLLGRTKKSENGIYQDRIIDIDILFFDDKIVDKEKLKVPHPLLAKRDFVLKPLCEIAPDLIHPILKKSIRELYSNLSKDI